MRPTPSLLPLLREACDSLADGLMLFGAIRDEAGHIVDFEWLYTNPAATTVVGRDDADLRGKRLLVEMPGNRDSGLFERYVRVVETGEPDQHEFHYTHEGFDDWFTNRSTKVGDGFLVTFQNITRQRTLERERDQQRQLLHRLFMQAPVAISVVRPPDFVFELANPRYEEMVGRAGITGKTLAEAFPELPPDGPISQALEGVIRDREAFFTPELYVPIDRDGDGVPEDAYFMFTLQPMVGDGGQVEAVLTVAVEVTERKLAEDALRRADAKKDEFLAVLAHELRNPLAVVKSAHGLLKGAAHVDPSVHRVEAVLERQLAHMSRLLDDLLDVGRLSSGKLVLERGGVDFVRIVNEVIGDHRAAFVERGLTFEACLPDAPLWIHGDAVRLAQVVDNLVTNALKYTPAPGRVDVSVRRGEDGLTLEVRDTGVGIEPELRRRIFQPFEQAPQNIARSSGGLGLGLALAERIVGLHGGSLEAESEGEGRGSVFTLRLPIGEAPVAAPPPVASTERESPRRFLVVEDNEDAAELVVMLLRRRGHHAHHVARGGDGVEAVERDRYDVVICDIGLPDMDGYEVARALRALPGGDRLKLVALSGYGQADDRRRSREAGFDAHLLKPASLDAVLEAIA